MSKKKDKSKSKKKFTGQVSLTRARKIFVALGFGTAGSWNETRLTKRIQKLPDSADGTKLEPKMQKRVNVICNALKNGKKVVVIDLDDVAAGKKRASDVEAAVKREDKRKAEKKAGAVKKEKNASKKAAKKEKANSQAKKAVTAGRKRPSKNGAKRNKFGSIIGSNVAKIDTALTKKPQTMSQLVKKAGTKGTFYTHMQTMIDLGHAIKEEKGFRLKN